MKGRIFILLVVIAVTTGAVVFFISDIRHRNDDPGTSQAAYLAPAPTSIASQIQAYILPVSEPSYIPILNSNVPRPKIDAKSALIYDLRSSRFLYQENSRQELPIASLTKIITAAVVVDKLNLEDVATVDEGSLRVDGEKQDLYLGEKIRVGDLLTMMLVASSNDAAATLAEYAKTKGIDIVEAMNEKARQLGMEDTKFFDPAGLNDEGRSTAYDLSKIIRDTLRFRQIWDPLTEKELEVRSVDGKFVHKVKNTDELLGVIPNIIGGKTGYTDGALGCLILLVNIPEYNDTVISIVLGSRDRFGDTQRIIEWVKSAYRWE